MIPGSTDCTDDDLFPILLEALTWTWYVSVEEFEEHCNNYHKERDVGFEQEYEVMYRNTIKIIHIQM